MTYLLQLAMYRSHLCPKVSVTEPQNNEEKLLEVMAGATPEETTEQTQKQPTEELSSRPSMLRIRQIVCTAYKLRMDELVCRRRHKSITRPRQIAMYLCREHTLHTYTEIARAFADQDRVMRDHTTIIHAYEKFRQLRTVDEEIDAEIKALEAQLAPAIGEVAA